MADRCDVLIIGAGVAGLTAAEAVASAGLSCVCVERLGPGGVVMNLGAVEDGPALAPESTGADLAALLLEKAMAAGAVIAFAEATALKGGSPSWVAETTDGAHEAAAVILATGLAEGSLGIAGEEDLKGRGLSTCAHCDGPMFKDQPVVVAGGDEWAVQEAIELAGVASSVTLVCAHGAPTASAIRRARLAALPNVRIRAGAVEALGANDTGLESVTLATDAGPERLNAQGIFVYTHRRPNIGLLTDLPDLDDAGRPRVDGALATGKAGLFAAGDVRAGSVESVAAAAEDGRRAARAAILHCRELRGEYGTRMAGAQMGRN